MRVRTESCSTESALSLQLSLLFPGAREEQKLLTATAKDMLTEISGLFQGLDQELQIKLSLSASQANKKLNSGFSIAYVCCQTIGVM